MSWLSNLSIKYKILLIPMVAILGFVLFLLFIINSGSKNAARLDEVKSISFPILEMANSNIVMFSRMNELMTSAASTGEQDMLDNARKNYDELKKNFQNQRSSRPSDSAPLNALEAELKRFGDISFSLTQNMIDGTMDFSRIAEIAENKRRSFEKITQDLRQYRDASLKLFTEGVDETIATEKDNLSAGVIIGVVTVVLTLVISFSIVMLITKGLDQIIQSLRDIAQGEGDLTQRLEQNSEDELGTLVHWFNVFVEKLHSTIGDVIEVITPLTNVSQELNTVSAKTSEVSSEQTRASTLVSNAMDDMLRSVTNVAENAGSAAQAAGDADGEAKQGLSIVQSTVTSINDLAAEVERAAEVIVKLESDTESVGGILDVIKGIAEQTNLLALNAAIEAARAGEQGRGFAVVADEVRTLASRTQESTHEIQTVIEQLQSAARSAVGVMEQGKEQAQKSVEQAGATGASLEAITAKVTSITDMNQQIAGATEEQQSFANDIQHNVVSMRDASEVAEQNTCKVSDLSTSLKSLADQLDRVSSQFKV